MKKFYFAMAMASALTFIPAAIPFDSSPGVTVAEAATAPDADLTNLRDDSATSIATLSADKPLFLNFWASWCPPCVGEMPHIDAMYQKYGDRVNFAAVSIDGSTDDAKSFTQGRGAASAPLLLRRRNGHLSSLSYRRHPHLHDDRPRRRNHRPTPRRHDGGGIGRFYQCRPLKKHIKQANTGHNKNNPFSPETPASEERVVFI